MSATLWERIRTQASVAFKSTHEYYEIHKKWAALGAVITIVSIVIGAVPLGYWGVALSVILGVASFYVGPKAATKVREIRHG